MKLYVYDHCPFCVRARMIFGLKNLPVELVVLANDDEATPIGLVGKKVVPILVKEDGTAMPESLDIVHYVDEHFGEKILSEHIRPEIEAWLKEVGSYYGHLTTARFTQIGLAEFETQSAVDYFTKKKKEFIGDFAENITVEGIVLYDLPVGTKLQLGPEVLLEVTQIGKECHHGCEIMKQVGSCIMPTQGIFGKVLKNGTINVGDDVSIIK